jgi:hypothetical protein
MPKTQRGLHRDFIVSLHLLRNPLFRIACGTRLCNNVKRGLAGNFDTYIELLIGELQTSKRPAYSCLMLHILMEVDSVIVNGNQKLRTFFRRLPTDTNVESIRLCITVLERCFSFIEMYGKTGQRLPWNSDETQEPESELPIRVSALALQHEEALAGWIKANCGGYATIEHDPTKLTSALLRHAETGDTRAQYLLALAYSDGYGLLKQPEQAIRWLTEAAKKEDVFAQCTLGFMYAEGFHVTRDPAAAVEWLKKASSNGSRIARKALRTLNTG